MHSFKEVKVEPKRFARRLRCVACRGARRGVDDWLFATDFGFE